MRREGAWCRPSPWWAVCGLIAVVVVLIAAVLVVELRTAPPEDGSVLVAGALSSAVGAPASVTSGATGGPAATGAASATAAAASADPLAVVEAAVVTVTARSARISLRKLLCHALATYSADLPAFIHI